MPSVFDDFLKGAGIALDLKRFQQQSRYRDLADQLMQEELAEIKASRKRTAELHKILDPHIQKQEGLGDVLGMMEAYPKMPYEEIKGMAGFKTSEELETERTAGLEKFTRRQMLSPESEMVSKAITALPKEIPEPFKGMMYTDYAKTGEMPTKMPDIVKPFLPSQRTERVPSQSERLAKNRALAKRGMLEDPQARSELEMHGWDSDTGEKMVDYVTAYYDWLEEVGDIFKEGETIEEKVKMFLVGQVPSSERSKAREQLMEEIPPEPAIEGMEGLETKPQKGNIDDLILKIKKDNEDLKKRLGL